MMKPFNLEDTPLDGVHLIEAGAGTGKTYAITGLFLRLIVEQGTGIERILVVTYTKAATEELKGRIRRRLLAARAFLSGDAAAGSDLLIEALVRKGLAPRRALQRIQDALVDFDRAAIFTIHGFCQRVLHHFAFETGHLFEAELVQDALPMIQEVADDFWRRYISRAPAELAHHAMARLKGPEGLTALFQHCRPTGIHLIPGAVKPALTAIGPWRHAAGQVVQQWPAVRSEVIGLLASEGLKAGAYGKCEPHKPPAQDARQCAISLLADAMDQWDGEYPFFDEFQKFCQPFLNERIKKNHTAPKHPFFDLCEHAFVCRTEMDAQLSAYLRYLKVKFVQQAGHRLHQKKNRQNILFFDDLLIQVHNALQSERRAALVAAIRMQYHAALVDEFQDTDPLQYAIFAKLFTGERPLLFMIGDPKQAIYSFRGADLYSYLTAKEHAGSQHTLLRNWRSTPDLIKALNTLFCNHAHPFGFEKIPFEPAVAANPAVPLEAPSFRLWYIPRSVQDDSSRPIPQDAALPRIVAAVADEIVRLLSVPAHNALAPEAIAVLTRTHRQAKMVKEALAHRRVPAVLHSAGRVFDTHEADELMRVMGALAAPADARKVRTALSTEMLGADADALCASMENPSDEWQARWALFDHYHQMWVRHGFYRMFSHFMEREQIKARLLILPDGERRVTNLLHLTELLHQAAGSHQLGPEGLIKWMAAQCRNGSNDADTDKLRLESDAHAVRIVTIHKSKGLEFDVVFCPFTWAGVKENKEAAVFHDPQAEDRYTLAIGPGIEPAHQRQAAKEALAENLRLLYVALTRARQRCYMVWGCINGSDLSAPAYLLHSPDGAEGDWMEALQSKMKGMTDALMIAELKALEQRAAPTMRVEALPEPVADIYAGSCAPPPDLGSRTLIRSIDTSWRVASFSAMISGQTPDDADRPGRDEDAGTAAQAPPQTGSMGDREHLFAFPRGARPGLFFHDLLEHWDCSSNDTRQRAILVTEKLQAHGFDPRWTNAVDHMLACLSQAPLPDRAGGTTLCLAQVPAHQRAYEMEFHFPLNPLSAVQLQRVFAQDPNAKVAEMNGLALARLTFAPMQGFLKGFMDMVFTHAGRFYLVDWKSNHLGNTWDDYTRERIDTVMAGEVYFLQYYLYVVALDQWLRHRVPDYDYETHFGGVYYLFLRGIQGPGAPAPATGIYYTVPDKMILNALKKQFFGL
jgi:exodeoxyribonuclease V beta subunit